ncbi:hypothetical protein D3C78_1480550 [compost metagenome]
MAAVVPAPVAELLQWLRHPLRLQLGRRDAAGGGPREPVVGVVLLDTDVAHQKPPRHVFAAMAAIAGLEQVLRHVQRKLLDHRPHPDQEQPQCVIAELGIAQPLVELVPHHALPGGGAVGKQLLRPFRITVRAAQCAAAHKLAVHGVAPWLLLAG